MEKYIKLSDVMDTLSKNQWAFTSKSFYFSLKQQLEAKQKLWWKLARVKSSDDVYPVEDIVYSNNSQIKYKVNGYWYGGDEKRQWWGRLEDIEIINLVCKYEISPLEDDTEAPEVVVKYLN